MTKQVQQDRDKEQVEAVARALVAVGALEVVLRQDYVGIVFALPAVKKQPINWGLRVMSRNAQNAERLGHENKTRYFLIVSVQAVGLRFLPYFSEKKRDIINAENIPF